MQSRFGGNMVFREVPHLLAAFFLRVPRSLEASLFYDVQCEGVRSIRGVRRLSPWLRLLSAIYLFRDTVFALARQNIARGGKEKRWHTQVFRDAFWRSPLGSFISSRGRKILDFEMYLCGEFRQTNFLCLLREARLRKIRIL